VSNRAARRANAASSRRRLQPSSVSTHHKFVSGRQRLQLLTSQIRRMRIDAEEQAETMLNLMASLVHEMAHADKIGLDALGSLAAKALDQAMTPATRASLKQIKWPQATDDTIEGLISDEVVRRSMIRSDLAITLGYTDRLALVAKDAKLEGRDPETAMREFYTKTLGDEPCQLMRDRLVAMKWRGANHDTLEDLIIYGVLDNLDRCVTLATQFSVLEDIEHDNPIQAHEGFERRLDDEFNKVLWPDEAVDLMGRLTHRMARQHYDELKDVVAGMSDKELTAYAKTVQITGDWATAKPKILKLGWKGASAATIDAVFMNAVLYEIRDMTRAASNDVISEVAKKYLARETGVTPGHLRCMEAVIRRIDELTHPLPTLITVVAFEIAGTVRVDVLDRHDMATLAASRPDIRSALDEGFDKTKALAARAYSGWMETTDPIATIILTDAAGTHVTTCCAFTPKGTRVPPLRSIDPYRELELPVSPFTAPAGATRVDSLNPSHRRCLDAIVAWTDTVPKPTKFPCVLLAFEDADGTHVVGNADEIDHMTRGDRPFAKHLRQLMDTGLAHPDLKLMKEPSVSILIDKDNVATWVLADLATAATQPPVTGGPGTEVAVMSESHERCLHKLIEHAALLPRPLTAPTPIVAFETSADGITVTSDPRAIDEITKRDLVVGPRVGALITEGLAAAAASRYVEPVVAVLGGDEGELRHVVIDMHQHPIINHAHPSGDPNLDSRWKKSMRGPTFYASTFDRALMRLGARLWQETYAKGMPEGKIIMEFDKMPDVDPVLGHFAALWAVHAFQRLSTSHTYAAAMMCTDADRESLATIQRQWSAFSVMVPNGMLIAEAPAPETSFEFTRILVALFDNRAELNIIDFTGPNGAMRMTIGSDAPTLPELLAPDTSVPPRYVSADEWSKGLGDTAAEQIRRCLTMAKRLVAGLLLSMQNAEAVKVRDVARRAGRPGKRDEEEPAHRLVTVGQPIKIDCREAVETFIKTGRGSGGRKSGLPQVQWIVRGHWRQQAYGVGRLGRKTIWIKPHWAGRSDAPILSRPKLVT